MHMMIKTAKLLAAAVAVALTACQQPHFTIEGTVSGAQDSTLYFQHASLEGIVTLDSVRLSADGRFTFTHDRPDAPEFYVLRIADQIINLSIDSTETVTVTAQWPDMAARYDVAGSADCATIRTLALKQQDLQRRAVALERNTVLSREQKADSLQRMLRSYKRDVALNFIYQHPEQPSSYFALFQTLGPWLIFDPATDPDDVKAFAAVATSWDTFHPGALRGANLHNIAIEAMNNRRIVAARQQQQLSDDIIVEAGCIELRLTDNNGRLQTLSALKGKVVLLDFHTFSLDDSPQRILMLRGLYNKYHDRGFEIYQVSLDPDEHYWKQMTRQLPWISVRDAEGQSARSYNVQQLPEFFLIDRQNRLQKRSSQMGSLDAEISSLL